MITDAKMTHPNTSIHRIIMTYTLAIHSLLNCKSNLNIQQRAEAAIDNIEHYKDQLTAIDSNQND